MCKLKTKTALFFCVSLIAAASFVSTAEATNYFAGYSYYNNDGSPPSNGVSATVYTVNLNVPAGYFGCQWSMVVTSHAYNYYTQIGYTNQSETNYALRYFWETRNSSRLDPFVYYDSTGPSVGTTHTYQISKSNGDSYWTLRVDGTQKCQTNANGVADYEAMSETTYPTVRIDNTHFTAIEYKQINDWYLWDQHAIAQSYPYTVSQTSNYEFTASGGG